MGAHVTPQSVGVAMAGVIAGASLSDSTPVSEGARARAIVDHCDKAGIAVVLLERTGNVLFSNAHAMQFLGPAVMLRDGRLRGRTVAADRILSRIVQRALDASGPDCRRSSAELVMRANRSLTVVTLDYPNNSPFQLVKAVVVMGADREILYDKLPPLMEMLDAG